MALKDEGLRTYARVLESNGFTIYEPSSPRFGKYFLYSQDVEGRECFGYVQVGTFGGYSHTMPIKPSIENGSSMWVDGVADSTPDQGDGGASNPLTVEAARAVAQPTNYNRLVGVQTNYESRDWIARGYTKRVPA